MISLVAEVLEDLLCSEEALLVHHRVDDHAGTGLVRGKGVLNLLKEEIIISHHKMKMVHPRVF